MHVNLLLLFNKMSFITSNISTSTMHDYLMHLCFTILIFICRFLNNTRPLVAVGFRSYLYLILSSSFAFLAFS
jgi:hypothetical protein